ncbi:MAG: MBL fold metallo-hydrolase [Deltaproteobacteria bacterium]|nr:MBL fold metallo-hydrolase [Deltaproteobacteria bacterium]
MNADQKIVEGVYLIGGSSITSGDDATVFLVDCGSELVMIDSGAGDTADILVQNIENLGFDPAAVSTLILTHCHIDHIGSAPYFKKHFACRLAAHDLDADAIETGDPFMTAANMYGIEFPPTSIDKRLMGDCETLTFGDQALHCLHIPGHTPGSIAPYLDRDGKRILFGQDIHGPFLPSFRSDIHAWEQSMKKLLALKADILCEGHFGIFRSREKVAAYITRYLKQYSATGDFL